MRHPAFTLIELLIVVAIISIVAAIAVPNFLEAQTRAKVARVRADFTAVVVALEGYAIEWNGYPPTRGADCETDPVHVFDGWGRRCRGGFRTVSLRLSTPVAYLTSAAIRDPFKRGADENGWPYETDVPADAALGYHNVRELALIDMEDDWDPLDFHARYGHWRIFSIGPGKTVSRCGCNGALIVYDPTNGTISAGQIVRTQMDEDGTRHLAAEPSSGSGS